VGIILIIFTVIPALNEKRRKNQGRTTDLAEAMEEA
jgi:hypothetical protein